MKLRTKKRLLNLASLLLVAGGGGLLWAAWDAEPVVTTVEKSVSPSRSATKAATSPTAIALDGSRWNRTLRRPLYDPPPPPREEIVIPPRPITIKLVGTVMEGENSQAFIRQQDGKVDIRKLGEQITSEAADGVIAAITGNDITIRREDGEHRVSVDARN